jgi:hypothetical protein
MENNYGHIIYEEMKSLYIEKYGKRGFFYQDYFENAADGLESFIESLYNYEDWLDLSKKPTDDDLDTVWDHISDGIFVSAIITKKVDSITDKYIGDS